MDDPLVELLEQCSVQVRGDGSGSGFFVAPGQILTCAHVVGAQRIKGSGGVWVGWGKAVDDDAHVAAIWPQDDEDFALLTVRLTGHPCVRLGMEATLDDGVFASGFPDYGAGVQWDGLTGIVESRTGLPEAGGELRFIKFKDADVIPGFSGGPLLNRRTGEVIGIVTETRGRRTGLGGWAVPTDFILARCPRLGAENDAFHLQDQRWDDARREQRRLLSKRRAGLSGLDLGLPYATPIDNFLAHYLGSPHAPEPFGGRDEALRRLREWLDAAQAPPYLLLAAPAGRGKSALLVHWYDDLSRTAAAARLELVFVPVSIRYEMSSQSAVFGALWARLSRLHDSSLPSSSAAGEDSRDLVSSLLCRPPPHGKRLLVILDGVDEAAGWDIGPAFFPHTPAAGVRLILSARLTATRATPEAWLSRLEWRPSVQAVTMVLEGLDPAGIHHVLERMGAPLEQLASKSGIVSELFRLTEGDPLLLGLYAKDLWARREEAPRLATSKLGQLSPGIEGYFDQWWQDQEVQWREALANKKADVQTVFNLLATALGPLRRRDLLRLGQAVTSLTGDALDGALATLARFVALEPASRVYVLAHPRFAQYRYDKLVADGEEETYEKVFLDWGRQALEIAEQGDPHHSLSSYIVQHYGAHLERAHRPTPERLSLASNAWRRAWESYCDEYDGFLADVRLAWKSAANANEASMAAATPVPFLADELRCALFTAEAISVVALIDDSLLSALVAQGVWSFSRGMNFALGLEDPHRQAKALAAISPHLDRLHLAPVEAAIDRLYDENFPDDCAPLIAALAVRLAKFGDRAHALVLARSRPGFARAFALVHLLPHLRPEEVGAALSEALQDAVTIGAGFLHRWLLRLLACQVDKSLAHERVQAPHGSRSGDSLTYRDALIEVLDLATISRVDEAWRLALAASWLDDSERHTHLQHAFKTLAEPPDDAYGPLFLVTEIVDLAPALDSKSAKEILGLHVDGLMPDYIGYAARAMMALYPRLSPEHQKVVEPLLLAAVPEVAQLSVINDRDDFFARLAQAGFGDRALQVIGEQHSKDWYTLGLIQAVIPFLDERQTRTCLELAKRLRAGPLRAQARSAALGRLASFGREQAREALAESRRRESPGEEDAVAAILLGVLGAPGDSETAARDGFGALANIQDQHLRLVAMVQVAAYLGQICADLFESALSSFGDSVQSFLTVEAVGHLAPYLAPNAATQEKVINAIVSPVTSIAHTQKELHITPYFRRLAALGQAREGLEIGLSLATPTFSFPLLCSIVGLVSVLDQQELHLALEAAEAIDEPTEKTLALLALIPWMAGGPGQTIPKEITDRLASFTVAHIGSRSGKIALVLGTLPEAILRQVLPSLATDELLSSSDYFAADAHVGLIPFLPRERIYSFRDNLPRYDSGNDRAKVRAALAVRLTALGDSGASLALCRALSGAHLLDALAGMLAYLQPSRLSSILDLAFLLRPQERVRLGLALASRWKDLSRLQLLEFFQGCLRSASRATHSALMFDLITLSLPLRMLGAERATDSVIATMDAMRDTA